MHWHCKIWTTHIVAYHNMWHGFLEVICSSIITMEEDRYHDDTLSEGPVWNCHVFCPYREGPNALPYWTIFLTHLEATMRINDGQISPDSMTHPYVTWKVICFGDHHLFYSLLRAYNHHFLCSKKGHTYNVTVLFTPVCIFIVWCIFIIFVCNSK